jgi:tripartite-type tricarboxylate transporter receptor subunit TctC
VTFSIDNLPPYTPHVKAGTLKLLAVTSAKRVSTHPDTPSLQEAGIADFDVSSWFGISAATGTPPAIINRFGAEIVAALADVSIASRLREVGAEAAPLGPKDYALFIEAEIRKWAPVIKASGASVD